MAIAKDTKPAELAKTLKPRIDQRVVVFGSSIPLNVIETMKMLRKARDEFHGRKNPDESDIGSNRAKKGAFHKRCSEYFDQKIG
jgi:hypothetical protein